MDMDRLDLVADSVVVCTPQQVITHWNAGAERLYGFAANQALGRVMPELLQCRSRLFTRDAIIADFLDQGHWSGDLTRTTRDGRHVQIGVNWRMRQDADGAPLEVVETSRDVSDARGADAALLHARERLRSMLRSSGTAYWELDFAPLRPMIAALREDGVRDIRSYLANNTPMLQTFMSGVRVLDANQQAAMLFGDGSRDALLAGIDGTWPADAHRFFLDCVSGFIEGHTEAAAEIMLHTPAGQPFDALFSATLPAGYRHDDLVLVSVVEIAAPEAAQRSVDRSDYRYRRLFPVMASAYWELDFRAMGQRLAALREEGVTDLVAYAADNPGFVAEALDAITVNDVNERTVVMMGAGEKRDLVGQRATRFWPAESHSAFIAALDAGYQGSDHSERETRLARLDGRDIDVIFSSASSAAMREASIVVLSVVDISERKSAERRLEESEYRSSKLFEAMALGIWELDFREMKQYVFGLVQQGMRDLFEHWRTHPDFVSQMMSLVRVVNVNPKTMQLFGAREKSQLQIDINQFWPPESHNTFLQAVFHTSVLKHDKFETETRLRRLDGSIFDGLFTSWEMPEIGDPNHVLVGVVDISDRVAARAELERIRNEMAHAARVSMLGELAASIAHEVNQPLAAITTFGQASLRWLDRAEPDIAEARELTHRMVADARRAADIIARIRAMAMPHQGTMAPLAINPLIDETLLFLDHQTRQFGATVKRSFGADLPQIRGDRTQLQQVVVNLMVNGMQAMEQAGSHPRIIEITTSVGTAGGIALSIADSGPGISEDKRQKVFDSFFTTKPTGMGMGLPICRSIVEAHGGTIAALAAPSGGAQFEIALPGVVDQTVTPLL